LFPPYEAIYTGWDAPLTSAGCRIRCCHPFTAGRTRLIDWSRSNYGGIYNIIVNPAARLPDSRHSVFLSISVLAAISTSYNTPTCSLDSLQAP
jgi:hypothetical protein